MANLITWYGLLEQARSSAFVTIPGPLDNPQNALIVLSRAQRELQDFTNAVRRVLTLTIDGTAFDGGYGESLDIKQPLEAQFTPTGAAKTSRTVNIAPEAMDLIRRRAQWEPLPPIGPPFIHEWTYTLDQDKIFLFPYQNVTGTFWIRYLPFLHEFQPSNLVGDWSGVTLNALPTWMKANGPDRVFTASAGHMADYLAMDLMEKYNTHKAYPERFAKLEASWERGKMFAVRNTPLQSKGTRIPLRNGPLQ